MKISHRREEWKDGDYLHEGGIAEERCDKIIRGIKKMMGGTCPPFLVTYKGYTMKITEVKVSRCMKLTKTAELV